MNFLQNVHYLQRKLKSHEYIDMLWDKIVGTECAAFATVEEHQSYVDHFPDNFECFLKHCVSDVSQLICVKDGMNELSDLDVKYICTLLFYILGQENATMEFRLNASDLYLILNLLNVPNKIFFYEVVYGKMLYVLEEHRQSLDKTDKTILQVMCHLKDFLINSEIPNCLEQTIELLCNYSYFNSDYFDEINPNYSSGNLGYIAFVGLQILTDRISQRVNKEEKLFHILFGMLQDLITTRTRCYSANVILTHQYNVRLFISNNFIKFIFPTCVVSKVLRTILLNQDFDHYEGVACIIEELPIFTYEEMYRFVLKILKRKNNLKINMLNYVVPLIQHPNLGLTRDRQMQDIEHLINVLLKELMQPNAANADILLRKLAECSDCLLGIKALEGILRANDDCDNTSKIMEMLYNATDRTWAKKQVNISYITLMCNLCIWRPDLFVGKSLNQLHRVCISGKAVDLQTCTGHFKRVLAKHSSKLHLVTYFLGFFTELIIRPQKTSNRIAEELYDFIFSNITATDEGDFIWGIVKGLFCGGFDYDSIFKKFRLLGLFKSNHVQILLTYKIDHHVHRHMAFKLLAAILNHVNYNETAVLNEKLDSSFIELSPTNVDMILKSILTMLGRKQRNNCSEDEIITFTNMQLCVYQSFSSQMFPEDCITLAVQLLNKYARVLGDGQRYSHIAFLHMEESLHTNLVSIREMKSINSIHFKEVVYYVVKFVTDAGEKLRDDILVVLEQIMSTVNKCPRAIRYFRTHEDILLVCVFLYIRAHFKKTKPLLNCVERLQNISNVSKKNSLLKLHIMRSHFDSCNMNRDCFKPLIPFLFDTIFSQNSYLRYAAMNFIIGLIDNNLFLPQDGQFFSFMGLLSDTNQLINWQMKSFMLKRFFPRYHELIAASFVSSIIHFNHYYNHPTINLTEPERIMLEQRPYSFKDRCCIYYYLYRYQPENVKSIILRQMSKEILIHFAKYSIPISPESIPLLFDTLVIILFIIPKKTTPQNMESFYNDGIVKIRTEILLRPNGEQKVFNEHLLMVGTVLKYLFRILYNDMHPFSHVFQNVLYAIISLTNEFSSLIKHAVIVDLNLMHLYVQLENFYKKKVEHFKVNQLSVNIDEIEYLSPEEISGLYFHKIAASAAISENDFNRMNET